MLGDWIVSREVPGDLRGAVADSRELFSAPEWIPVLQALGGTPKFVWHPARGIRIQLAIFHRMGVPIGYMGFPVAGECFDEMDDNSVDLVASQVQKVAQLPLLRVVRSGRDKIQPREIAAFPEALIEDLGNWSPTDKRLRKDLAFARRSSENLDIRAGCTDPVTCHFLYLEALRAHGGNVRYTLEYFRCLAHLAERDERVRFYTAIDVDEQVRGFSVVVRNRDLGYYLHGAVEGGFRKTGIGDRLVHHMIRGASEMGCNRLSMMASPWDQPGLHAYKMKWCGNQKLVATADYSHSMTGRMLSFVTKFHARKARKQARHWNSKV